MTKVSDMLPATPEQARIIDECRRLMSLDLDEADIAVQVQLYNNELAADQEAWLAAWGLMGSAERASWKKYCQYDRWLAEEMRKHAGN